SPYFIFFAHATATTETHPLSLHDALPIYPESRHAVTRKLGAFRTSMLQDVESGRPVELDALVGAVIEIARQVDVPTPNIDALFGDRKSTRLNSSHVKISYAVFCLKKKKKK